MKRLFCRPQTNTVSNHPKKRRPQLWLLLLCSTLVLVLGMSTTFVLAQSDRSLQEQENQLIREYALPSAPAKPPVYKPRPRPAPAPKQQSRPPAPKRSATPPATTRRAAPASAPAPTRQQNFAPARTQPRRSTPRPQAQPVRSAPNSTNQTAEADNIPVSRYELKFNRSPIVGNRLRLEGVHAEARLGFTRPRSWDPESVTAKALIRFRHSPELLKGSSMLTLKVNDTSVGTIALNRKPFVDSQPEGDSYKSEIGNEIFYIPRGLLQDYNDISLVAQQNNAKCSDSDDPELWTEILPDSHLSFEYKNKPTTLNFNNYPYPFFDEFSLDPNRVAYLLPRLSDAWLTAAPRLQAALGRFADFRPIETKLVEDIKQLEWGDRLMIIGTPADQPALKSLDLPFEISNNNLLDGEKSPLPADVGVLMLTTISDDGIPVLVATGNGTEGVIKAVQFLVQPDTRKLGTGPAILVTDAKEPPPPPLRQWPGYLPEQNTFQLSDLRTRVEGKPFKDITVRGSQAPIEFDFRALPDDRFKRGSSMNLIYSYGPQVNPRTSAVEVLIDDVLVRGKRLTNLDGENRQTLKVNLPSELIKPNSKLQVAFRLDPREPARCGKLTDDQLTGTLHADSSFQLNRETSVELPDLKLLQSGFPFTAPQDLSKTAIILPETPSDNELLTMLALSERLGKLSSSKGIGLEAYTAESIPPGVRDTHHLVGIGTQDNFPFQREFNSGSVRLGNFGLRQSTQASAQNLSDEDGMIQEIVSPNNRQLVILGILAQADSGLERVRQLFLKDPLFYQLEEDTAFISSQEEDTPSYDSNAYKIKFFNNASSTTRVEKTTPLSKASRFLQNNWYFLPLGIIAVAILLYGVLQLSLKRVSDQKGH
ncbi:MAG: cellulose biosynthesis cyclic di-GMP-binding regulatory protein BcsB [Symploca sp. SIO1C4]|uniref:Cellulose biosynthesis cyclic di-GMP-binding regulatory protein BcsB n=1 Tax=Symploca sp. SIO1C4 TaxID=2607765 RepID=A0A6B3N2A4_9CYAN|nr:cellulose biosynthesis cyclic di-GMP-binding regulatory protein BcsB [Symploca sp. SIO1C4]